MIESTCPHKWDFRSYGTCPMCLKDMQNRHSPNYISTEMLRRIEHLSYTNDLPSRYVRMMASELLSLRQQIGQRQAELEFIMQKNMEAAKQEPAQSGAEPVGYISGWIDGHLTIRLLDPALALSTGTALFLQPPTVPHAISEPAQAVPVGYRLQSIAEFDAINEWIASNDDLTIAYMRGKHDQKAIDHDKKQKALDFVRWIASLKTGGLIQARANDLLSMLETDNE